MKHLKRFYKVFVLLLVLTFVAPTSLPMGNVAIAQAATIKISKKTLTLEVGKTAKLKMNGTTKKTTWSSSDKAVAKVSSKGTVTAVAAGTAKITATVSKKKYTCKVTVTEPINPDIANAPFEAQELVNKNLSFIIPKDWTSTVYDQDVITYVVLYPAEIDLMSVTTNVTLQILKTDTPQPDYSLAKGIFDESVTSDLFEIQLQASGINAVISDYVTSDYETNLGTAYKISYIATAEDMTFTQELYYLYIDNYFIQVIMSDFGDYETLSPNLISEYILKTIKEV